MKARISRHATVAIGLAIFTLAGASELAMGPRTPVCDSSVGIKAELTASRSPLRKVGV